MLRYVAVPGRPTNPEHFPPPLEERIRSKRCSCSPHYQSPQLWSYRPSNVLPVNKSTRNQIECTFCQAGNKASTARRLATTRSASRDLILRQDRHQNRCITSSCSSALYESIRKPSRNCHSHECALRLKTKTI